MAEKIKKEPSGDEMKSLEDHMGKLDLDEKRDINILLLGETGVGKSTFINSFCNYLHYMELRQAMKNKLTTLIPTKFTITDENYEEQVVQVGADANEFMETGMSATQGTRSYVFPIRRGKVRVRLIDTPGVGDVRGIDQDNVNFENILSFIGELKHLNAICILLKPNNARLNIMFKFCIKQLLSRLEKSASSNLVFVFTNSRSTFYRPGETLPALKKLLQEVDSVTIPLTKDNIFCTDNEAFRFLAAVNNGIKFSPMDIENFAQSWKKSVHECWRMISYIAGSGSNTPLEPHQVKKTISVNEARRLVVQLSQPLAEIAQLIQDNIYALSRHKASLELSDNTLADLKRKLYIPVVNLRIKPMKQPTTVCTSPKCSTVYQVGERQKWHYHQKCHSPCYLTGVPKEIVGSPLLASCAAMNGTTCQKCTCDYQVHMHIYYETETYEDKQEDGAVKSEITNKQMALIKARYIILKIERRLNEYYEEKEIIIKTTAKFAHFLQANAITPYNDAYEGYLLYLIDREKSMGACADYEMINEFKKMLQRYAEEKNALTRALAQSSDGMASVTADDIIDCVGNLYNLTHNGLKIKELFDKQKPARKDENQSETREYVHAPAQKKQKKKKKNKTKMTNDTTDSDCSAHNYNPSRQQPKPNFVPIQYNQRQYNRQNYHQYNEQPPTMPDNQQKTSPLQYLQIKQSPSGQLDFRFGQGSQVQKVRTPEPTPDFRSQPSMPNHGAYPKHTSYSAPPQRQFNQQYRGGNPNHYQNPQGPQNYNQYPGPNIYPNSYNHQGPQHYNQHSGPHNRGGRPYNATPRSFNLVQNFRGPQNYPDRYNDGGKHFDQGPNPYNHGGNAFGQGPNSYNNRGRGFNQGPKPFNQRRPPRNNIPFNQRPNKYMNDLLQLDSGCESAAPQRRQVNSRSSTTRRHFLEDSSSESSSDSDNESYQTCK